MRTSSLAWHPSDPPFGFGRHAPAGRRRSGRLQVSSRPPVGKPRASAPTRRPASFGEEAKTDLARSTALGLAMCRLERPAFRTGHRQAADRHCLAPERLSTLLAVENPARPARSTPMLPRTFANYHEVLGSRSPWISTTCESRIPLETLSITFRFQGARRLKPGAKAQ